MWEGVTAAIAATLAAIVAALGPLVVAWLRRWADPAARLRQKYIDGLTAIAELYRGLADLAAVEGVARVIVFAGHNCGGLPSIGSPYWVRGMFGVAEKGRRDPSEEYNFDLTIDRHYVELLKQLVEVGEVHVETAKLEPTSKLRGYYDREGVTFASMYFLGLDTSRLIYLSVAKYDAAPWTAAQHAAVGLAVDRLRAMFRDLGGKYQ